MKTSKMLAVSCSVFAIVLIVPIALAQVAGPFDNTIDPIPPGWKGPIFELSKDYPTALPTDPKPWKAFKFDTQPKEYMQAVLAYALEGNDAVDWKVQNNATRKWYHAPGLLTKGSGREFIRGLTRERVSKKGELHKNQDVRISNWAVGFFNPIAAYTIGKVWANPDAPETSAVKFEDGAVAYKLLFTSATAKQVPFLNNSFAWQANVDLVDVDPARQPREVLLLQVDIAVRDDRVETPTGWVFGTFMYQDDAPGKTPFERLVPVGLMWGNDPDLTKAKYDKGDRAAQSWLNLKGTPATKSPHFGFLDRLNGPVDNPLSSCLSCHARAVAPYSSANIAPGSAKDADDSTKKFFTNTKAGEVYDGAPAGVKSLDYSLQLGVGIREFPGKAVTPIASSGPAFNDRGGEPEEPAEVKSPSPMATQPRIGWYVWGGAIVLGLVLIIGIAYLLRQSKGSPH